MIRPSKPIATSSKSADQIPNPIQTLPRGDFANQDPADVVHAALCDGKLCENKDEPIIVGPRYSCYTCKKSAKDVDFCSVCVRDQDNKHDQGHLLLECLSPTLFADKSRMGTDERNRFHQWASAQKHGKVWTLAEAGPQDKDTGTQTGDIVLQDAILNLQDGEGDNQLSSVEGSQDNGVREDPENEKVPPEGRVICMFTIDKDGEVTRTDVTPRSGPFSRVRERETRIIQHGIEETVKHVCGRMKPWNYVQDGLYRYFCAAIPATRVIDLMPGCDGENLVSQIRCIRLDEKDIDSYEAISYTWKEIAFERQHIHGWGDEEDQALRGEIDLQHALYTEEGSFIPIGVGLRDALCRLRYRKRPRTLWCDQVCIDQNNNQEKNLHIQLMSAIYNRARRVIVWTGEMDHETESAYHLLNKLGMRSASTPAQQLLPRDLEKEQDPALPSLDSDEWRSLLMFLSRPVFSRGWVVQEIVLGREVSIQCGDREASWPNISTVIGLLIQPAWLERLQQFFDERESSYRPAVARNGNKPRIEFVAQIDELRKTFARGGLGFATLLEFTCSFGITDARDKVFAPLALAPPWTKQHCKPDYDQTVQEVFRRTTKAIIGHEHTLAPFSRAGIAYQEMDHLSSWVADWSYSPAKVVAYSMASKPLFRACGDSRVEVRWPYLEDDSVLQTRSYKVATVFDVCDKVMDMTSPDPVNVDAVMRAAASLVMSRSRPYPLEHNTADAFVRTWIADSNLYRDIFPAPDSFVAAAGMYLLARIMGKTDRADWDSILDNNTLLDNMVQYWRGDEQELLERYRDSSDARLCCLNRSWRRRFFITDMGYFGFGPDLTAAGDEVHILPGGVTPYIMRRCEDPDGHFLVGDSYVHGIMLGEALQIPGFEWTDLFLQ